MNALNLSWKGLVVTATTFYASLSSRSGLELTRRAVLAFIIMLRADSSWFAATTAANSSRHRRICVWWAVQTVAHSYFWLIFHDFTLFTSCRSGCVTVVSSMAFVTLFLFLFILEVPENGNSCTFHINCIFIRHGLRGANHDIIVILSCYYQV